MHYEHTFTCNDSVFQMISPFFQPLRLRTPRVSPGGDGMRSVAVDGCAAKLPLRTFTVKGGFVSSASGGRRMVIVGTIFRRRES
jgi:hypothetical protein